MSAFTIPPAQAPARIPPELRALLMTARAALLMIVAGIDLYLGIASKR